MAIDRDGLIARATTEMSENAPGEGAEPAREASQPVLPEPAGWSDPLSGADGPRLWDRTLSNEQARLRRYGRGVTVVLLELGGFAEFATWVGREAAMQAFSRLSRIIVAEVRSSDHIARIASERFGILLVETDEVRTLNFINRILAACEPDLRARRPLRIGIGWASPAKGQLLTDAVALAEERLASDFFGLRSGGQA